MGDLGYGQLSVLVVDHHKAALARTNDILGRLGVMERRLVSTLDEAVRAMDERKTDYDVVMAELNLPGGDGVGILRALAERNSASTLIFVTGVDPRMRDAGVDLARARGLRVLGALPKPIMLSAADEILSRLSFVRPPPPPKDGHQLSEEDMRGAVDADQLLLYFQPKISMDGARILGAEALVRWMHPTYGMLQPDAFISQLVGANLIEELTRVVLDKALAQLTAWRADGLAINLSINIAAESLDDIRFPSLIEDLLNQHGVPPSLLTIEVTETGLLRDHATALDILTRLRLAGMSVSLDDFGTGYATISRLDKLPFDELKLDRSMVTGAPSSERARTILGSTLKLAHDLNMRTVAEGVETIHEWTLLREHGCQAAQGFYMAMPMPGDDLPGWAVHWASHHHTLGVASPINGGTTAS